MRNAWSLLILLAAEFTFAALFLRALLRYLHRRDPLQRDITWVFAPPAVLFVVDVANLLPGHLPHWVGSITLTTLLAQPYLTVRLAARLRSVPRWLEGTVLAAYVLVVGALVVTGLPLSHPVLVPTIVLFLAGEAVAEKARCSHFGGT